MCEACIRTGLRCSKTGGGCSTLICRLHQLAHDIEAQLGEQRLEQFERLALVFVQRIALAIAAQAHILAQVIEIDDVLAPVVIQRLQQDRLFRHSA